MLLLQITYWQSVPRTVHAATWCNNFLSISAGYGFVWEVKQILSLGPEMNFILFESFTKA